MNNTQIQTTIAPLVTFFAGLLAGKGVFGFDAATWTTIIGAAAGLAATIWAAVATKKTALITTVAKDPDVAKVQLASFAPQSVVDATPNNVTK